MDSSLALAAEITHPVGLLKFSKLTAAALVWWHNWSHFFTQVISMYLANNIAIIYINIIYLICVPYVKYGKCC